MDLSPIAAYESEVRSYVRSFPVVFDRARGSIMIDAEGGEYIDFFTGAGTLNYGHNNPRFKQGLIDCIQNDAMIHTLDMATTAKVGFLKTFSAKILEPRNLSYKVQFPGPTGTNAAEAAIKLARLATGRVNIVAFTHGYHGVSLGSLAATADGRYRAMAGQPLGNVTFAPYDGYLGKNIDTIDYLRRVLEDAGSGTDLPAAVIVETVQGEGGVNVASSSWLQSLAQLCKQLDILLIVDDIQAGCGRTGKFFSFEESGIVPDIVILSKSLSGYGIPMAAVLIKPEHDVWLPGAHTGTFRGNSFGFTGARLALENYWADDALEREAIRKGELLQARLEHMVEDYPSAMFSARGRGMFWGLASVVQPGLAKEVATYAFQHGLVIETSGAQNEVLKFLPALTIEDDLLDRGLDIIEAGIQAAVA